MADRPPDLPDFNNPPLVEVGMSVQFEPLHEFQVAHLGQLWSHFKENFPLTEQHPPADSFHEDFSPPSQPTMQIQLSNKPPIPCVWFLKESGSELIRVQPDRFSYNWRKKQTDLPYPRYESIRDDFKRSLEKFKEFVESERLGKWNPTQCDILYVNHIFTDSINGNHGDLNKVMNLWRPDCSESRLPELENVLINAQYILKDENQDPVGRFYVYTEPAFTKDENNPLWKLHLFVRGAPAASDLESVMSFLEKGRDVIVRGFTSITTAEMHKIWERRK